MNLVIALFLAALAGAASGAPGDAAKARGDAAFAVGDMTTAEAQYRAALRACEAHSPHACGAIRHQLAFTYLALDRLDAALPLFLANLEQHLAGGHPRWAAPNFLYAGRILLEQGRHRDLLRLLQRYPAAADPDADRRARITHLQVLALEALGRRGAARDLVQRARHQLPAAAFDAHLAADATRLAPPPPDPLWRLAPPLLAAPLLLALVPALRRRLAPWLLLAFSTALALTLAELLARHWLPDPGLVRHFLNRPGVQLRFTPAPGVMPGIDYGESRFTVNDVGLRGDDLAAARGPRILVIGGSSVEALFVDDAEAWPHYAQRRLARRGIPAWIANAGKSGLDSFAHRVQLHHALRELHPQGVIVQAGVNDLNRCISGGRARYQADARRAPLPDFPDTHPGVFAQVLPPQSPRLALLRLLTWAPPPAPPAGRAVPQDAAGAYLIEQRRRRQAARIVDQAPDVSGCLAIYRDNLRALVRMALDARTPIALFTQGNLYRDDLETEYARLLWFGSVETGFFAPEPPRRYYSVRVMARLMDRYNHTLLEVCREAAIPCLDVDRILPKDTRSYYDDVHLNRAGSRRLGEHLAAFLLENRWLP